MTNAHLCLISRFTDGAGSVNDMSFDKAATCLVQVAPRSPNHTRRAITRSNIKIDTARPGH